MTNIWIILALVLVVSACGRSPYLSIEEMTRQQRAAQRVEEVRVYTTSTPDQPRDLYRRLQLDECGYPLYDVYYYESDGVLDSLLTVYTVAEGGRIVSAVNRDSRGESTTTYEYDEANGRLLTETYSFPDEKRYRYTYDKRGRLLTRITDYRGIRNEWVASERETYTYKKGVLTEKQHYYGDELATIISYRYDAQDQVTQQQFKTPEGDNFSNIDYTYRADRLLRQRVVSLQPSGRDVYEVYEYIIREGADTGAAFDCAAQATPEQGDTFDQ